MPLPRILLLLLPAVLISCARAPVAAEKGDDKPEAKPQEKAADTAPAKVGTASSGPSIGRNMVNLTDKGITDDFVVRSKGKEVKRNVKWAAALGTLAYGGPVVAGGKIYIGTNNEKPRDPAIDGDRGVLMCFNEADGKFLWQHTYEKLDADQDTATQGIASSPWVEGDRLWYVNNRAEFICSDTSGKVVWKYDMIKELDIYVGQLVYTSPLVVGDLVYALTCNGADAHKNNKLPKPKAPSLVALNKTTGKLVWTNALPGADVMRGQWSNASAALVDGKMQIIYGGGDGWLYGLDAKDGALVWKFDCNPKKATPYKAARGGEKCFIIATPVVHEGRCYVGVSQEVETDSPGVGHLWCIDITKKPTNKDKDLSPVGDDFDPKAKANADSGLVWHYGGRVVPKPKDDEREWYFGHTMSTVAVHDGIVYAAELAGYLHAIDAKTGKKLWEHDFTEDSWCSPYYVDGKVYLGTNGSALYIFPAGRTKAAPKKVEIGQNLKMPVVAANGVLYINAGSTLYAIKK